MRKLTNQRRVLLLSALICIGLFSCKKDSSITPETYPPSISNIAPQSMIDSLRAIGATIYSGTKPPIVNGIYYMHPDSCTFDNSPGNFTGVLFADYKFKCSNQDNNTFTLVVDQKNTSSGALSPAPVYTYISGSGNNFSIFILRTVSATGIEVQQFNVLSGTLTANGVQNFQNVLYIRSKGSDPGNTVPPAGTIRLFVTGAPGLATNSTTF